MPLPLTIHVVILGNSFITANDTAFMGIANFLCHLLSHINYDDSVVYAIGILLLSCLPMPTEKHANGT